MVPLLIALLLPVPGFGPFGPDAARIAELDLRASSSLCSGYHHGECRAWRMIVSDVRCKPDPADGRRALCTFKQKIPDLTGTESCSAAFESIGGAWYYPHMPDRDEATLDKPLLRIGDVVCSAVGAPDSAAVKAIREAAHPSPACVLYPGAKAPCPPASSSAGDARCTMWRSQEITFCTYRLGAPEEYYCKASFRLERGAWTLTGGISRDGRFAFDEDCSGPVTR